MANITRLEDIAIQLAKALGPKSIENFSPDDLLYNYSGRQYPSSNLPLVRLAIFGSAYDAPRSNVMDTHRLESTISHVPSVYNREMAAQIGKESSKHRVVLVTGACPGIPDIAVQSAKKENPDTFVIGISPSTNEKDHVERNGPIHGYDWIIYTGSRNRLGNVLVNKGILTPGQFTGFNLLDRDVRNVEVPHAGITLMGGSGTLDEIAGLWEAGKIVGLLRGTGGVTDSIPPSLDAVMQYKQTGAKYILDESPSRMVQRIVAEARLEMVRKGDYPLDTPFGSAWIYRLGKDKAVIHFKDHHQTLKGTSPVEHHELTPEFAVMTSRYHSLRTALEKYPGAQPLHIVGHEGDFFEVPAKLSNLRKTLHQFTQSTPDQTLGYIHFRDHRNAA